jgi:thymidine kinase
MNRGKNSRISHLGVLTLAKLYFRHAPMNAGKSIDAIRTIHNYEEKGKRCVALTSVLDDRYGTGVIASRIGVDKPAICISSNTDVYELIVENINSHEDQLFCVVVDEAQFLLEKHVIQFVRIVDELNIPVICYGLKNTFMNTLFEGSAALLVHADIVEEGARAICTIDNCHKKATMIVRLVNDIPTYNGDVIQIGGNREYASVCRKHYFDYPKKECSQ